MSRKRFLISLVGLSFLPNEKALGSGSVEVWLKIYGATTYGHKVIVFDNRGGAIINAPVVGASRKLADKRAVDLAGGSVVLFGPWDQDETQLVPVSREEIALNLRSTHTLTVIVNDGTLSLEYN